MSARASSCIRAAPNTQSTNSGAAFSPDGRTVYFSVHAGGYTGAEVGQYQVMELDRKTGESRTVTNGYGGGLRPITVAGRALPRVRDAPGCNDGAPHSRPQDAEGRVARRAKCSATTRKATRRTTSCRATASRRTRARRVHRRRQDQARRRRDASRSSVIPFTANVDLDLAPLLMPRAAYTMARSR